LGSLDGDKKLGGCRGNFSIDIYGEIQYLRYRIQTFPKETEKLTRAETYPGTLPISKDPGL
jgi:hypothetical protein